MDKATKVIRRSGVRLKSLSSGHGDIQMIISQLGEVRTSFKAFAFAQAQTSEDAMKWASSHENRAIGETFAYLVELSMIWSEVQRDFVDQLKEYKSMYELILEGEKHVTQARETLTAREQREAKLRKEYKKASKKAPEEEVRILKERLNQAERSKDLAHLELVERVGENEAVKMIRVKEGLLKLGASYQDLAQKAMIVFSAHQSVTSELPDVHDKDLHDVKYTGSDAARKYVIEAREKVRSFSRSYSPTKAALPDDPPPPYTPSLEHLNDLSHSRQNGYNGNGNSHNIPSDMNNSSSSQPSGIRSLLPSPNNNGSHVNGISPGPLPPYPAGVDNRPTAPSISSSTINSPVPNSPPSHIYPELPSPYPESRPNIPQSPPGPESPKDNVIHFQSVPNLGDESSLDHGLKYPPLNVGENSCFNDSNFHPDTSSSSPSLLVRHLPDSSTPENAAPFNPYYDWLPSHIAQKFNNDANKTETKNDSPPGTANGNTNNVPDSGKIKSVRPKRSLNPFVDDESSDDDGNKEANGAQSGTSPSQEKKKEN